MSVTKLMLGITCIQLFLLDAPPPQALPVQGNSSGRVSRGHGFIYRPGPGLIPLTKECHMWFLPALLMLGFWMVVAAVIAIVWWLSTDEDDFPKSKDTVSDLFMAGE